MHNISKALLKTPISSWYRESLRPICLISDVPPFIIEATFVNFRNTYHCYVCRILDSRQSFLVICQAYIDGFYSESTGLLFRHPGCYLAEAHDSAQLAIEAGLISASSRDTKQTLNQPIKVLSGSQSHLAHYLWNHLSALYRFFEYAVTHSGRIDEIVVYKDSELFGSLPSIFTKLGRLQVNTIELNKFNPGHEIAGSLQLGIILEPYENGLIPAPLANAIVSLSNLSFSRPLTFGSDSTVIAYGIRIGNRRPTNRHELFKAFLESSLEHFDSLVIVIDVSSRMFNLKELSPQQKDSSWSAVSELKQIAADISPLITIYPLVDSPIYQTISILQHSLFGVYEWGANLTWFSWILRKPVVAFCPPKVRNQLIESQQRASCWGSYFWESDVPLPLLPISNDIDSEADKLAQINRFSPEDYIIEINSFQLLLEISVNRAKNFMI
jgi:hypothetical protein